jgi:shikimate kinase
MKQHIYLTGFMGSGKSTIGKKLAKRLGLNFIDVDDEIEKHYKKSITDIFKEKGESWFRDLEEDSITNLSQIAERSVISLGGGALISELNLKQVLKSGNLIYIESSAEEIWKRIRHSTRRPLMRDAKQRWDKNMYIQRIGSLLEQRKKGYQSADIIINRDGIEADEVAELILQRLQPKQK